MTENKVAVCDGDKAYVEAFTSYLMEHIPEITIYSFTSEEAFIHCGESFEVGILSGDFLGVLEFSGADMVKEKLYLCDENILPEYEHLPMVYKYQSMEIVEEMLRRMFQRQSKNWWDKRSDIKTKVVGIYSPISHELSMPFALSLSEIYRERGRVLFLDIEENSIMGDMTGQRCDKSLMDLLYMIVQQEHYSSGDYISSFMGVDYINPFSNPEELNDISEEMWNQLMDSLLSIGYDTVVILFGRTIPGFRNMLSLCEDVVVLGKPGDYYRKSQANFMEYVKTVCDNVPMRQVSLPMTAGNLVDGTYAMEELVQGNLGMFVRKAMQEWVGVRDVGYGTA